MENSGLRIPQAPSLRATADICAEIRANARGLASRAAANNPKPDTRVARADFFPVPVRESVASVYVAAITCTHSRVHEQHGKRTTRRHVDNAIGSAKPTLRPRGS